MWKWIKKQSWKFFIPFGIIWFIIFYNSTLAGIGFIFFLLGLMELFRELKAKKSTKL